MGIACQKSIRFGRRLLEPVNLRIIVRIRLVCNLGGIVVPTIENSRLRSNGPIQGLFVGTDVESATTAGALKADDEGSIPFTRSNLFNGLDVINRPFQNLCCCSLESCPLLRVAFLESLGNLPQAPLDVLDEHLARLMPPLRHQFLVRQFGVAASFPAWRVHRG
jgi:hypothetical protein